MENEAQTSRQVPDSALRKSIEAWEHRRRLRYVLVPVGILLLIVGLTLRHTVPGKVMAVFGAVFVGMYRYNGSAALSAGIITTTAKAGNTTAVSADLTTTICDFSPEWGALVMTCTIQFT